MALDRDRDTREANRAIVMVGAGAGSAWLFVTAKSELSPLEDRGVVLAIVNSPDGATLDYTARYLQHIERIAAGAPEFDRVFAIAGNPQVSQGFVVMRTTDWSERERSTQQMARQIREETEKFARLVKQANVVIE